MVGQCRAWSGTVGLGRAWSSTVGLGQETLIVGLGRALSGMVGGAYVGGGLLRDSSVKNFCGYVEVDSLGETLRLP